MRSFERKGVRFINQNSGYSYEENERKLKVVDQIREALSKGDMLSAREEMVLEWAENENLSKENASKPIEAYKKVSDGTLVIASPFEDDDRHSPRSVGIVSGEYERLFWVTFLIGCEGEGFLENVSKVRTRDSARLENALNDLDSFYEFYQPPMFGDIWTVGNHLKLKSPGFFNKVYRLENPSKEDFKRAVNEAYEWVRANVLDPEFGSLQINFFFSGHGYYENFTDCGIVLKDGSLPAETISSMLYRLIPPHEICASPHRLDLFLDCCHAGGIAFKVSDEVLESSGARVSSGKAEPQEDCSKTAIGNLSIGRMFCSSMHDEVSFESDDIGMGYFTSAFLAEFSSKEPSGRYKKMFLKDVGWMTNGQQHPFFISFLKGAHPDGRDFIIKFPSLQHFQINSAPGFLKRRMARRLSNLLAYDWSEEKELFLKRQDVMPHFYNELRARREVSKGIEKFLRFLPMMRSKSRRDIYGEREIHWF